jgi:hypothetical protein
MVEHERVREMLLEIDEDGEGLTSWEIDFVADLVDRHAARFTAEQAAKIEEIHRRRVEDQDRETMDLWEEWG